MYGIGGGVIALIIIVIIALVIIVNCVKIVPQAHASIKEISFESTGCILPAQ